MLLSLYVFCAYHLLVKERHHRRRRDLIFYKLATLRATAHSRPNSLHRYNLDECTYVNDNFYELVVNSTYEKSQKLRMAEIFAYVRT